MCFDIIHLYTPIQQLNIHYDYDFLIKTMFSSSLLSPVVWRRAQVLFRLFVFVYMTYSGVQCILCCVFVLFFFVLCTLVPILPVSLDCPFLIAPLVFSNVYYTCCKPAHIIIHVWLEKNIVLLLGYQTLSGEAE